MLTVLDKIELKKQEVRDTYTKTFPIYDNRTELLIGTIHLVKKMDYGFHIYHIFEPSERNPIYGKNGILTEMYYDLRNRIYWIKRNEKEVKFSVRNVDAIFDRGNRSQVFDFLSTDNNNGLYEAAFRYMGAMGNEVREMFGRFFYRLITEHSYFEQLYKAGVKNISEKLVKNKNGNSPQEIMGLSKTQWKICSKYKVSPYEFVNNNLDTKKDIELINYLGYIGSLEMEYGIDKINSFISNEKNYIYNVKDRYGNNIANNSAIKICKQYNLPIKRVLRYLYFECDVSQGMDAYTAISQYKDYIRMTNEMEYEKVERYPKFLKTYHDIVSRNYKVKLDEIQQKQWDKKYLENKKFEYSYYEYKFILPETPKDLIKEGNVLGHCVGSYVNKVWKGESVIVFLREKESIDTPLVTIEIKGDMITQARGKMNNEPSLKEKEAIKKYAEKKELIYNR